MTAGDRSAGRSARLRDGKWWRIGTPDAVAWIAGHTTPGRTISSAIPAVFEAYATILVPEDDTERIEQQRAMLRLLTARSGDQPWWLGYLDTGTEDLVFPDAPMVTLYEGWRYVVIEAGAEQAGRWREDRASSFGALPELMFPADRSWLISRLWDDDWRCVGGPDELIGAILADPALQTWARAVALGEDATPPGYTAR
jgi:hypothetical protein